MGRKRKNKNPFAEVDGFDGHTPYAMLTDTMASNPTYQKLSSNAKEILSICKLCRKYHTGTDKDGKSRAINGDVLNFYFNRSIYKLYGLTNPNRVVSGLAELTEAGFIDVIENNKNARRKNVYCFSSKWRKSDKEVELSDGAKTFLENTKRSRNKSKKQAQK